MLSEYMFEVALGDFLDRVGREATPGGGAVAALSIALAAGLVEMSARASAATWPEAAATIAEAQRQRQKVTRLAPVNASAYAAARHARDAARDAGGLRNEPQTSALARAAEVPLGIAEAGAAIAALAARVVARGDPDVEADARTAALLAAAATAAAAHLVEVNLVMDGEHPLVLRSRALDTEATGAAGRSAAVVGAAATAATPILP